MAEIINFMEHRAKRRGATDGPPPFKPYDKTRLRVLLKRGVYGPPVEEADLWKWLNENIDRISPRVSMAVSIVELKRKNKSKKP